MKQKDKLHQAWLYHSCTTHTHCVAQELMTHPPLCHSSSVILKKLTKVKKICRTKPLLFLNSAVEPLLVGTETCARGKIKMLNTHNVIKPPLEDTNNPENNITIGC